MGDVRVQIEVRPVAGQEAAQVRVLTQLSASHGQHLLQAAQKGHCDDDAFTVDGAADLEGGHLASVGV
eukprot:11681252-Alexandrium_andersonii.AAC.1